MIDVTLNNGYKEKKEKNFREYFKTLRINRRNKISMEKRIDLILFITFPTR